MPTTTFVAPIGQDMIAHNTLPRNSTSVTGNANDVAVERLIGFEARLDGHSHPLSRSTACKSINAARGILCDIADAAMGAGSRAS